MIFCVILFVRMSILSSAETEKCKKETENKPLWFHILNYYAIPKGWNDYRKNKNENKNPEGVT